VALRIMEFISACIVLGITSRFIYLVDQGHGRTNGRLIYTEAIAAISLTFSILLSPPFSYSFWAFPLDLALFICWMVAFGILDNVSIIHLEYNSGSNSLLSLRARVHAPAPGIGIIGDFIGAYSGVIPGQSPLLQLAPLVAHIGDQL
jgi:hypothetical protein